MKKLIFFTLLLLSASCNAQTKLYQTDSTGNVYVLFVRPDSVAVVYQGSFSSFTSDGVYAKDFSAFDLKLKGFLGFDKIKSNIYDVLKKVEVNNPVVVNPPSSSKTKAYRKTYQLPKARYFVESEASENVSHTPQELVGMDGYDFAPIVASNTGDIWSFGDWKQEYLSIDGNRSVWQNGAAKYFLKPAGYKTDLSYNLMDFDLKFPNFILPNGKSVIVQATPLRKNYYLQKGVSYVKDTPGANGYAFVGDQWLYDLGCPMAYVTTQSQMDEWCESVDSDDLLKSFIEKVYYPNKDYGYVMLNWEAVGHRWHKRRDKIIRCLEYWAKNPHNAKLSLWTVSGISIPRPVYQGIRYDYTNVFSANSLDELAVKYRDWVTVDFDFAKYVEVGHIGGYQIYPNEDGIIHHYLTELLLHRKFNKNKQLLATIWHDQEPISNFNLDYVEVDFGSGKYYAQVKPKVQPSMAYNWGVWTVAVGDGFDCWSDPNYWSDNKADWGVLAFDSPNGKELPIKFGEKISRYSSQPMKAVDWMMSGVWCISENKDILEAATEWNWLKLPSRSYFDKSLLLAYKLSRDGSEALVLALDAFGRVDGETSHEVVIDGKPKTIKTYGRFTSVVRLKL